MKMKREHQVPLSPQALALLNALPRMGDLVFASATGKELSDATLSAATRRMHEADIKAGGVGYVDGQTGKPCVPHGLRSTFRDWCGTNAVPRELAELSLAHKFGNEVEQSYARDPLLRRRAPVMNAWADFITGVSTGKVVALHG
jgi:integrase